MYKATITYMTGRMRGMTVYRLTSDKLERGRTYNDPLTNNQFYVDYITEIGE
jgi:hypothetical protein